MFIPRNSELESPTSLAVLGSGLVMPKANVVYAHRGADPIHDLIHVPQGISMILSEGLAFLATGEQSLPAQIFTQHLASHVASAGGPVGGIYRAVMAGAKDLSCCEPSLRAALQQSLDHPDTFVIPFVDIIQAEYVPGSKFRRGRRPYTVLMRESAQGARETVRVIPTDSEMVNSLFMLRFLAEKRAIRRKILGSQVALDEIELAVFRKYREQFPSTLGSHRGEMVVEIQQQASMRLEANGSSLAQVDAKVLEQLEYFRVIPDFAKYFALAS